MEVASVLQPGHGSAASARALEFAAQLRTAVMAADEVRIARLLSELLRVKGLTRGQRVALQLRALNLLSALHRMALNDETTGLCNRRGFVQAGTRLLDLAARDRRPVHLVFFHLGQLQLVGDAGSGSAICDIPVRQMGNLMRDLFPGYGVYEVLGRLSLDEFAALTPSAEHASRNAIMLHSRRPLPGSASPALRFRIGIAHFDPQRPLAISELLRNAERSMYAHESVARIASFRLSPPSRDGALLTVSRRRRYRVIPI